MEQQKKQVPFVKSRLRHNSLKMLKEIRQASDIVILNAPITNMNLLGVFCSVAIPVIITVVDEKTNISVGIEAGASILNVAGALKNPELVQSIRKRDLTVPIIAIGDSRSDTIWATRAGGIRLEHVLYKMEWSISGKKEQKIWNRNEKELKIFLGK